jgi:hypothetical protein
MVWLQSPVTRCAASDSSFEGLEDAAWSSWLGNMVNANHIQGFLHASYSLGATFGPTIATSMIVKAGLPWYTYYYMMVRANKGSRGLVSR